MLFEKYQGIKCHLLYDYFNYRKDLTYLLPGAVRKLSNYDPQKWINRIHHHSSEVMRKNPYDCKAKFVGKFWLKLSLFVSSRQFSSFLHASSKYCK